MTGADHEVIEAHEGHAGLAFCSETAADVVVVNLTLPDMDGVEFIRRLRHGCPRAKVVAMAGRRPYGAPDPLAIATQLSDVRGLRWPFALDRLLSAVREVLEARN
jgi:DNA-binding NarL/FixJ family response regulator